MRRIFPPAALVLSLVCLLGLSLAVTGCNQQRLYPEQQQFSQFDRYHLLRGEEVRRSRTDALGRQEPALRERLSPPRQQR